MNSQASRPVRIGILLNSGNSADHLSMEKQYTMDDEVYEEIASVLSNHGAEVHKLEVRSDIYTLLQKWVGELDLIFNLAEGIYQVLAPKVLEQLQLEEKGLEIAFTGSTAKGHTLALDKAVSRKVLFGKVSQPAWWYLESESSPIPEDISFPVLVKPTSEGHSIGIKQGNVVHSQQELEAILNELFSEIGGGMLIETFLDGEEYSMGMIGNVVFPAAVWDLNEMPGQPLVRGEDLKQGDLTIPHAEIVKDPAVALNLAKQVIQAHHGLGLKDYSRSDFRAKKGSDEYYFLEVNSMCGIRRLQSVLPWTASHAGVKYEVLIGAIVAQCLKRLSPVYLQEVDTESFDQAYQQLQEHARATGTSIQADGEEYFMLKMQDVKEKVLASVLVEGDFQ